MQIKDNFEILPGLSEEGYFDEAKVFEFAVNVLTTLVEKRPNRKDDEIDEMLLR